MIENGPAKPKAGKAKTTKDTIKAATAKPAASTTARKTAAWTSGAGSRQGFDLQARIERRAYELWERDGRPEGRDYAHWQQAEREIGAAPAAG